MKGSWIGDQEIQQEIHCVAGKFFYTLINSNGILILLENYQEQLCNIGVDASKFAKSRGAINGEDFIHGIQFDLNI